MSSILTCNVYHFAEKTMMKMNEQTSHSTHQSILLKFVRQLHGASKKKPLLHVRTQFGCLVSIENTQYSQCQFVVGLFVR